jgi:quinol monooxygenase YgiN
VKQAEPNVSYRLHRSAKDPTAFLFYEVYPSQAARDKHLTETLPALRKEAGPMPEDKPATRNRNRWLAE